MKKIPPCLCHLGHLLILESPSLLSVPISICPLRPISGLIFPMKSSLYQLPPLPSLGLPQHSVVPSLSTSTFIISAIIFSPNFILKNFKPSKNCNTSIINTYMPSGQFLTFCYLSFSLLPPRQIDKQIPAFFSESLKEISCTYSLLLLVNFIQILLSLD